MWSKIIFGFTGTGVRSFCSRYANAIDNIITSLGTPRPPSEDTVIKIADIMEEKIPLEALAARRKWRDSRLASLAKLKRDLEEK